MGRPLAPVRADLQRRALGPSVGRGLRPGRPPILHRERRHVASLVRAGGRHCLSGCGFARRRGGREHTDMPGAAGHGLLYSRPGSPGRVSCQCLPSAVRLANLPCRPRIPCVQCRWLQAQTIFPRQTSSEKHTSHVCAFKKGPRHPAHVSCSRRTGWCVSGVAWPTAGAGGALGSGAQRPSVGGSRST